MRNAETTLEKIQSLMLPFHAALGNKFDDACHRLSSAFGACKWADTEALPKCDSKGKVTVGTKSVTMLADGAPTTILFRVACQIAAITGGVKITSSLPPSVTNWAENTLHASKDGESVFTRKPAEKLESVPA